MKLYKLLILFFIFSFVCSISGASAWTYTAYSHVLKSLKGATEQATLTKSSNIDEAQILEIGNVQGNKDIEFRISHNTNSENNPSWTDSTWNHVSIDGSYPDVLRVHGGYFTNGRLIALTPGQKKLTMRTATVQVTTTALYGVWWVNESEYNQYNNK